jgi:uncharacterized membrane protein
VQLAPVEYVVIDFPGNQFQGDIAPAIERLVANGVIRIIDLLFVKKDADGGVLFFEYDELDEGAPFAVIDGDSDGVISDTDIDELAADLPPDSSALFIVFEDLWADELGRAVRGAGGELIAGGRIPHDVIERAISAASEHEEG